MHSYVAIVANICVFITLSEPTWRRSDCLLPPRGLSLLVHYMKINHFVEYCVDRSIGGSRISVDILVYVLNDACTQVPHKIVTFLICQVQSSNMACAYNLCHTLSVLSF
jgi:hypothetical protein